MASIWQQLIKRQITLDEALKLLVSDEGIVNLDQLDLDVNHRFRRAIRDDNGLPPVIPLLLQQNRYYLGSYLDLGVETLDKLRDRTKSEIEIIPIAEKSYRDWCYIQELDITRINPNKFVEIFQDNPRQEDLGTLTEMCLLRTGNTTDQLNVLIASALYNRVSDIHLEPTLQGLRIRYRIDGILRTVVKPSAGISLRLIMALKVMCDMDIADNRRPQDGRLQKNYATEQTKEGFLDMRVSTFPGAEGEKAVVRLLPRENPFQSVKDLGFTQSALNIYRGWLQEPQGVIILTGPTGSGKTSTLYTSLQEVSTEAKNVVTIEDPVEYKIPGITQGQVLDAAGMTFASGLRAILRQDPDIIMVGEIRDEETAETAVQAAQTGHLVFTTMHTNDAVSAVSRLKGLGLEPGLISEALLGIVGQRLVRKVCSHCAVPYEPTDEDLQYLGLDWEQAQPEMWRQGRGCSKCFSSGYLGREGIIELLNVDSMIKQFICKPEITQDRSYFNNDNLKSFKDAAIEKVITGVTTVEELKRVLPSSVWPL